MRAFVAAGMAPLLAGAAQAGASQCYGAVSRGRLEGGVKLPLRAESLRGQQHRAPAGRTYVHSSVAEIVLDAFTVLRPAEPSVMHVYGETGWAGGGRFRPHRTYQNGLSMDFFMPVRDAAGVSVPLPASPLQRFGYDVEFGADARYGEYSIDFPALSEHL